MASPTPARIDRALTLAEVRAVNDLTRRWFAARAEPPAAAAALGVWPLLAALASGATGRTRDELLEAAGLAPERAAAVAGALLDAAAATPAVRLALGAWAGARVTLDPEWSAALPVGAVGSLSGDAAADKAALDAWAERHTDGLIDRMPVDLSRPVDLLLAGALLVRTTWVTPFRDAALPFRDGPWSGLGPCRTLAAVIADDVLRLGEDASVLTVPGRDDIDVLLCLGRKDLAPAEVIARLVEANADPHWGRSSRDLAPGQEGVGVTVAQYRSAKRQHAPDVDVRTVRFTLTADLDLGADAAALGLESATDPDRAEFGGLAAEPTYVSQARQTCTATFSATGFEAAAVTAMAMARAGALPNRRYWHRTASIEFDRPFAYAARHRPSGLILVAGWVAEPERA